MLRLAMRRCARRVVLRRCVTALVVVNRSSLVALLPAASFFSSGRAAEPSAESRRISSLPVTSTGAARASGRVLRLITRTRTVTWPAAVGEPFSRAESTWTRGTRNGGRPAAVVEVRDVVVVRVAAGLLVRAVVAVVVGFWAATVCVLDDGDVAARPGEAPFVAGSAGAVESPLPVS